MGKRRNKENNDIKQKWGIGPPPHTHTHSPDARKDFTFLPKNLCNFYYLPDLVGGPFGLFTIFEEK